MGFIGLVLLAGIRWNMAIAVGIAGVGSFVMTRNWFEGGPLTILLEAVGRIATMASVVTALLLLLSAESVDREAIALALGAAAAAGISFSLISITKRLELRVYQRIREVDAKSLVAKIKGGAAPSFTLYLRPFASDGLLLRTSESDERWAFWRQRFSWTASLLKSLVYGVFTGTPAPTEQRSSVKERQEFFDRRRENDIEQIVAEYASGIGPLVAAGTASTLVGAAKLDVSASWQDSIELLMAAAQVVFIVPWDSEAVIWEIRMANELKILQKTVFVMPGANARIGDERATDAWRRVREKLLGVVAVPQFGGADLLYTLNSDGTGVRRIAKLGCSVRHLLEGRDGAALEWQPPEPSGRDWTSRVLKVALVVTICIGVFRVLSSGN